MYRFLVLSLVAVMFGACNFESDIVPFEVEPAPEQPAFGAFDPASEEEERFPGEALIKRLDEMFDPFYIGEGIAYEGTVYQHMDQIIGEAYEYYGYDLATIAANGEPNPLTDDQVFEYLSATNQHNVYDSETGDVRGVYDWHTKRVVSGNTATYISVLDEIDESLRYGRMNYERNYLAALYKAQEIHLVEARLKFRLEMIERFGDDAEGMITFLDSLDPSSE